MVSLAGFVVLEVFRLQMRRPLLTVSFGGAIISSIWPMIERASTWSSFFATGKLNSSCANAGYHPAASVRAGYSWRCSRVLPAPEQALSCFGVKLLARDMCARLLLVALDERLDGVRDDAFLFRPEIGRQRFCIRNNCSHQMSGVVCLRQTFQQPETAIGR